MESPSGESKLTLYDSNLGTTVASVLNFLCFFVTVMLTGFKDFFALNINTAKGH